MHKHTETRYEQSVFHAYCTCGERFSGYTPDTAESVLLKHLDYEAVLTEIRAVSDANNAPSSLTFTLTIELGGEGMQSDLDIAAALREVADTLSDSDDSPSNPTVGAEVIRDVNGNTCGSWAVK